MFVSILKVRLHGLLGMAPSCGGGGSSGHIAFKVQFGLLPSAIA